MALATREIGLGTVFTGKVDSSFRNAANRLRTIVTGLAELQTQIAKTKSASVGGMTLYDEFSNAAKAQGEAVTQSAKYQKALTSLIQTHGDGTATLKAYQGTLNRVETAIQNTGIAMTTAGKNGIGFINTANRLNLVNQVVAGNLKATATGFKQLTTQQAAHANQLAATTAGTHKLATATSQVRKGVSGMHADVAGVVGVMDRLSRAIKVVASYAVAGAGFYALTSAVRGAGEEIVSFDQALKSLQAITQANAGEIGVMGDKIKEISANTAIGPQEVAKAMILLGQAGLDASQSINAINATTTLAVGAMAGLEATADLMTTALMAFNLNATESSRVADIMANAMNKSKLDIDKLRTAFNYVGASAAESGLTLEQTAASMMVLSNAGLRASTIGTGLRQILSKLINPNEKLRETYEAHGIALEKINPATIGWAEALKNLSAVLWDQNKQVVDMSKAYKIFELRGAQSAAVLVRAFKSGDYQKMLEFTYATGSASAMAATQMEGLGNKITNLMNLAKLAAIALGEAGLAGAMHVAVDALRALLGDINAFLSSAGGQFTVQVLGMTLAIYGLIKAFSMLGKAFAGTMLGVEFARAVSAGTTLTFVLGVLRNALVAVGKAAIPLAVISGIMAVVAYANRMAKINDITIQQSNEQIVKNQSVASSLESYRGALQSLYDRQRAGQDVQLEYHGLIQRLIQDHKELPSLVDMGTVSYKNFHVVLNAALKKLSFENIRKGADGFAKSIVAQAQKVEELSKTTKELVTLEGQVVEVEDEMTKERGEALKDATDKTTATQALWVEVLKRGIVEGGATQAQMETLVRSALEFSDAGREMANVIVDKLGKAMTQLKKDSEAASIVIKGMPPEIKAVFDSLSPLQQVEFLPDYTAYHTKLVKIKQELRDMGKDSKQVADAEKIAQAAFLEKFQGKRIDMELDKLKTFYETDQTMAENTHNRILHTEEMALAKRLNMLRVYAGSEEEYLALSTAANRNSQDTVLSESRRYLGVRIENLRSQYAAEKRFIELRYFDEETRIEKIRELDKKYVESKRTAYASTLADYRKMAQDLIAQEGQLLAEIKKLQDQRVEREWDLADKIYNIRKESLTTTEAIGADMGRAEHLLQMGMALFSEGEFDKAEKNFKDSATLYESLGKSAAQAYQKIREGAPDAANNPFGSEAKKYMEDYIRSLQIANEWLAQIEESKKEALFDQINQGRVSLSELENQIKNIQNSIGIMNQNALVIDASPSLDIIYRVIAAVETLAAKLNVLDGRTISIKLLMEKVGIPTGNVAESIMQGLNIPTEQSGTGLRGLPETGLFYGHKGEIVKNPAESESERRGEGVFSKVLHTIDLKINGASHRLYGEESSIKGLVKTLKREQLVTA